MAQTERPLLRMVYACTEQESRSDAITTEMLGRGWSKFEASGRAWGERDPAGWAKEGSCLGFA
jgi:hypothetical protein